MRKWMRVGAAAGWLLMAALGNSWARAQVATTTVQDTVTDASGNAASGTVVVSWGAFTTAAGSSVAAGSLTTTLGAGGALNVALQPNAAATPMGSYYTAVFHLSDGTVSREFWVVPVSVPGGGPAKLAGIRNQVLPTSVAMQTVSKQYVDTTVAKALAGVLPGGNLPYVLKAGDTMGGALALAANPTQPLQAATKQYVDGLVGGAGVGGAAGGDLGGSYPNPTVTAVHAVSGSLDGVPIGQSTPAAVAATTIGIGTAVPETGFPAEILTGSLLGFLLQANSGDDSPNLYFHGSTRYLSMDEFNGHYRFISEDSPGSGGYVMLDCDGSGTVAGMCTSHGPFAATSYHETLMTPSSSSAACSAGDFTDDANFHYVCVAANSWKRVGLSAF